MHAKGKKRGGVSAALGWIVMLVLGVAGVMLGVKLIKMGILPNILVAAYVLLIVVFELLLFFTRRKFGVNFVVYVISLVLAVVLFIGFSALSKVDSTVENITTSPEVNTQTYSVVTLADSGINDPAGLANGRIAYMDIVDEASLTQIRDQLTERGAAGAEYVSCNGPVAAADALMNKEVDAAVFESVYIDMLSEDIYEGFAGQIKEICTLEVIEPFQSPQWTGTSRRRAVTSFADDAADTNEDAAAGETVPTSGSTGSFVVYISGIDTYGSVSVRSRSDVNILAVVNLDEHKVQLINTPRDYYVALPISNGTRDKLTHAGIYGIDVSIGALEMLYDVDIDHYVRVNFSGFEDIIDALGGIDVESDYSFSAGGYYFNAGTNHLNGSSALAFARERHAFAAGDVQRGRNQMAVITAMIDKILSPELLRSYTDILNSISGSFQTDFTSEEIYSLVSSQLLSAAKWTVDSYTVTGYDGSETTYSVPGARAYVMYPNEDTVDTAKSMIYDLLD